MTRTSCKRKDRTRNRPGVDTLEARQLMAYSPFNFSRPDLVVEGYGPPVVTYGESISVIVDVQNLGAASILEPLAYFDARSNFDPVGVPRYMGKSDAPASVVGVFISDKPVFDTSAVLLGTLPVPAVGQNQLIRVGEPGIDPLGQFIPERLPDSSLPPNVQLPGQPAGTINDAPIFAIPDLATLPITFPESGQIYLYFQADFTNVVAEHDEFNNYPIVGVPMTVIPAGPDLGGVGLDVARGLQPGDLITPNIKVINYGSTNIPAGEILDVDLVATLGRSQTPTADDTPFARFGVAGVVPQTLAPTKRVYRGLRNLDDPANVTTVNASPTQPVQPPGPRVRIPNSLNGYRFGMVVDPDDDIEELSEPGPFGNVRFDQIRRVGAPLRGVGPSNFVRVPAARPLNFPTRQLPTGP